MSLRVAASEQALIKVRAAEAGLSASAYLRQSASSGAAAGASSANPCRYRAKFHVGPYPRAKLLFRLPFSIGASSEISGTHATANLWRQH